MKTKPLFLLSLIATIMLFVVACKDEEPTPCSDFDCVNGNCSPNNQGQPECMCIDDWIKDDKGACTVKEIQLELSEIEYFCPQRSTVGKYLDGGVDYTLEVKLYIDNVNEIWADISFSGKEITSTGVFSGNWREKVGDIPESYQFIKFVSDNFAELAKEDTDIHPDEFYDYDMSGNLLDRVIILGNTKGQDFPCEAGNSVSDRTQLQLLRFNKVTLQVKIP